MAEYTDLQCTTPMVAQLVVDYLQRELADMEDAPNIAAYVEKSTVRITYHDLERTSAEREGWDSQLLGFRDGVQQVGAEWVFNPPHTKTARRDGQKRIGTHLITCACVRDGPDGRWIGNPALCDCKTKAGDDPELMKRIEAGLKSMNKALLESGEYD